MFAIGFALLNIELTRTVEYLVKEPIPGWGSSTLLQNVTLTALWSVTALVMLGIGFLVKSTAMRYVALMLFAVSVLKILIVDMASVDTMLRVLSLLAMGVMLFVVSFWYHKSSGRNGNGSPVTPAA